MRYWLCLPWNLLKAWWTTSIYVFYRDADGLAHEVFLKTYPAIPCHCGAPTTRFDSGDIYQYQCAHTVGCCMFCRYEAK